MQKIDKPQWHRPTLAALLASWMLAACQTSVPAPFWFDGGRLVVRSTPREILDNETALRQVDDTHVPPGSDGGVLLDGEVDHRMPDDAFGQHVWAILPSRIYVGSRKVTPAGIQVVSPRIEDGGIELVPHRRYRLFAAVLDGRLFIWKGNAIAMD